MGDPQPTPSADFSAPSTTPASKRWSWRRATLLSALILYLPHLVPLLGGHLSHDSSCRQTWLEQLPLLPGLWASAWLLFLVDVQTGDTRRLLAGVLTVLGFASLAWLLSRGPRVRWTSAAIATAYFVMNAGFLQVLFAM